MKETAAPWAEWLWKGLKVIFVMIVVLGLAAPILVVGSFMLWDPDPRSDIRKVAGPLLQETGIRVTDAGDCSHPVQLRCDGRDFCDLTAFQVRWRDDRRAVSDQLPSLPNWHMAEVSVDDYFALTSRLLHSDALIVSPPPGTVFDAWYYAPGKASGANEPGTLYNEYLPGLPPCYEGLTRRHCGFTLAFYDADTGLFWHVSQHQ